jgi:hypothetical protein
MNLSTILFRLHCGSAGNKGGGIVVLMRQGNESLPPSDSLTLKNHGRTLRYNKSFVYGRHFDSSKEMKLKATLTALHVAYTCLKLGAHIPIHGLANSPYTRGSKSIKKPVEKG